MKTLIAAVIASAVSFGAFAQSASAPGASTTPMAKPMASDSMSKPMAKPMASDSMSKPMASDTKPMHKATKKHAAKKSAKKASAPAA